ncbi:prophage antirepressor [Desulfofarcimen acetoxidans DSM 771]|uniref:Prophage antirepressor n=1 Tax=Desulfofarcimen acetoxidans (strain ATCC 49208 / DSM 771 / KCTC 5769 / VKM B-1644 / 5575) TaxID=485916 RepID=C8VXQ7_DESAS|nr:Bro-N domain-containing protein [Desulfofarcimen acetoxidans]ACV62713.1 prophage antirepressor [Desulfofarcimen acetoxidans DSM 771]
MTNSNMNELQKVFNYEGQQVRTVLINGEPWFAAKDVCDILEISNSRHATSRLPERMKDTVVLSDAVGRTKEMTIISEPGLYKLVVRSDKPEAEKFTDWVVEEVLPSIRKTGTYSNRHTEIDLLLASAEWQVRAAREIISIKQQLKITEERLDDTVEKTGKIFSYLTDVPDRAKVNRKIKELARCLFGGKVDKATNYVYDIIKDKYGIDVFQRVKNARVKLNRERSLQGKGPYAESTLKQLISGMDIVESEELLDEMMEIIVGLLSKGYKKDA